MADDVEITAGTGTKIATDQVTTTNEHVQLFKLAYSADGVRTLVTADSGGLLVNLGTNNDVTVTGTVDAEPITVYGGGTKTDTSDQAVMAGAASNYNYLCYVSIYNSSSTNTYAILKDNTTVVAHIPLPAYGGAIFQPPHPLKSAATNTAWNVAAAAGVTTASFYGGGYRSTT